MVDQKGKVRGLGRGLSALMSDVGSISKEQGQPADTIPVKSDMNVPIEKIFPNPDQPRRNFTEENLNDLANSIRAKGIIQPLVVRERPEHVGEFEIVAGERRWRAAQIAQLHMLPVVLRRFSDTEVLEVAIIENIQRTDLNPVEEAQGYKNLMERFGRTQEQMSEALGKSRSHIANLLRLLNLSDEILTYLREGQLTTGHARALITSDDQLDLARLVVKKGLSVRETERLVRRAAQVDGPKDKPKPKVRNSAEKDADTRALEADLSAGLGMKVLVSHVAGTETGTISITYTDLDQLDDLCRILSATQQVETK